MKLTLPIRERIDLQSVLPREATYLNMKMVRKLREDLSFSDAEHKKISLKGLPDGSIQWDASKKLTKKVEIPDTIVALIRDELKRLDKASKIREEHLSLFDKFIDTDADKTA
jgi:hypothetical protein